MKKYVAGFLFSEIGNHVILIEKQKPDWQKGKLNAIGGKIEEGESAIEAMRREFKEEAGLDISDWTPFCVLTGNDEAYLTNGGSFEVHFFSHFSDDAYKAETVESEQVICCPTKDIHNLTYIIPNLKWLVPMALERSLVANVNEFMQQQQKN